MPCKVDVTDQIGQQILLNEIPKRIVCLNPSQTETLVHLGLEHHIVGITKFCVHPTHLRKTKTVVGGTKKVAYEKIRALKPDIILCNKEENTQEMVNTLQKEYPAHVTDVAIMDHVFEMIQQYGRLFRCENEASELCHQIATTKLKFERFITDKPKRKVAYFIWKNPWMVAGRGTFINAMLQINGFENVFEDVDRYPEIELQELQKHQLDLLLLSSEPFPFKEKDRDFLQAAFPDTRVVVVNGEFFSWYGSRLTHAFSYFKELHSKIQ